MKCSTYSQMERKGNISVDKLMAIAEVFGVNPAVLLRDPMDLQTETETAEAAHKAPTAMHEPVYIPTARPAFVTTKNEENLLTVLRNLPKADVEEIRSFINEKYQNSKRKK